jgi:hypothetical protein
MSPPETALTQGTVKVMFEQIQKDLDEIKKDHKEDKNTLHKRVNEVETCVNHDVKPQVQENKTNIEWVKGAVWYIAGIGSSALLLVIGVIAANILG